jgi:hypothetical protein
VLLTWLGSGNAFVEMMLTIRACERLGIKTTLVTYEYGGKDGVDSPLLFYAEEADAVVSTGSRDRWIGLPAADKVIGPYQDIRVLTYPGAPTTPASDALTLDARDMIIGGVDNWGGRNLGVQTLLIYRRNAWQRKRSRSFPSAAAASTVILRILNWRSMSFAKAAPMPPESASFRRPAASRIITSRLFYGAFLKLGCKPSVLTFFKRTPDLRPLLLNQDVIYVGGGNTKSLIAVWRDWGVIEILREAWEAGVVLTGVSAGAICWFEQGLTDSFSDGCERSIASAFSRAVAARITTAKSSAGRLCINFLTPAK